MPEGLALALQTPGLVELIAITILAGLVYGFAGFGAALIYVPLASAVVPPSVAIPAFQLSALISLVTVVPPALGKIQIKPVATMIIGSLIGGPIGVWMLSVGQPQALRWGAVAIVSLTLLALILGWRYRTTPGWRTNGAMGLGAGAMGGATGLNGPLVVIFQLGGPNQADQIRANMLVFLTGSSMVLLPIMAFQGLLPPPTLWLGSLMLIPYGGGSLIGQALFTPGRQGIYRNVALVLIAVSVVMGLPVWD